MAHRVWTPGFSAGPYNGLAVVEDSPASGRNRLFLVGIQRDLLPPISLRGNPLQRMRVIVVEPNEETAQLDSSDPVIGALPAVIPSAPPAFPIPRNINLYPRVVQGEILRDESERLYEKIGDRVRPLHSLVSGPHGEILDLTPIVHDGPRVHASLDNQPVFGFEELPLEEQQVCPYDREEPEQLKKFHESSQHLASRSAPVTYRRLFPDPGLWRVIRLGDFKEMLAPQLAHPERLRDAHRLPCCLQIYEAMAAQRLESLAAAVLGDPSAANQLRILTDAVAVKLAVTELLQTRPRVPGHIQREPGVLLPYERVFRLQLADDPTMDGVVRDRAQPQADPDAAKPSPSATSSGASSTVDLPGPKHAVPERFLKPWEFQFSREEALYDMNLTGTSSGLATSLCRRLKDWMRRRRDFRKWQVLLCGKTPEEQLWAVRPPKGGLSHPPIREWASRTLQLAGYDPRMMLLEWEIFWRRKGL